MRIIKNLSPGKKKADDGLSTKKSVSFAQYEPGQSTKDDESKELFSCKSQPIFENFSVSMVFVETW